MRYGSLLIAILFWAVSAGAQTPAATGSWSGVFTRDGADLPVTLRIDASASPATALLSADDLRIVDFPLRNVTVEGDRVAFELIGDATTTRFEGRVESDGLAGTMIEGGRRGSFALTRRSADAGDPCMARPARFANGAVTLSGTLLRPRGGPARPPAMLIAHGSGAESRDGGRFLATALCRSGVAALIYDKRGVGESTGEWRGASFEELAADAAAGLAWLAAQEDVDPRRLGLYGHSQGGSLVPMIANRSPHVAFLVAGAGSGIRMDEVERFSLWNAVRPLTAGQADAADARAYIDRLVAVAATGEGVEAFIADAQRFRDRRWFEVVAPPSADAGYWRSARASFGYDPAREWRHVRQPALLLYGDRDERTPVEASVAAIRAATEAGGNREVRIEILPGAGHAFDLGAEGRPWPRVAPGYPALILVFAAAR